MPRWRKPTKDEIRQRRVIIGEKARSGTLALPHAVLEMRQALGLSQADFAKLFRLTTRQVAELERGDSNPTIETLDKIGRVFGFQVGFIPKPKAAPAPSADPDPEEHPGPRFR
jgi:transcriptional regulator with XRE-family HTH domain